MTAEGPMRLELGPVQAELLLAAERKALAEQPRGALPPKAESAETRAAWAAERSVGARRPFRAASAGRAVAEQRAPEAVPALAFLAKTLRRAARDCRDSRRRRKYRTLRPRDQNSVDRRAV